MATGKAEITVSPICSCSRLDLLRSTENRLNVTAIGTLRLSVREYGVMQVDVGSQLRGKI